MQAFELSQEGEMQAFEQSSQSLLILAEKILGRMSDKGYPASLWQLGHVQKLMSMPDVVTRAAHLFDFELRREDRRGY